MPTRVPFHSSSAGGDGGSVVDNCGDVESNSVHQNSDLSNEDYSTNADEKKDCVDKKEKWSEEKEPLEDDMLVEAPKAMRKNPSPYGSGPEAIEDVSCGRPLPTPPPPSSLCSTIPFATTATTTASSTIPSGGVKPADMKSTSLGIAPTNPFGGQHQGPREFTGKVGRILRGEAENDEIPQTYAAVPISNAAIPDNSSSSAAARPDPNVVQSTFCVRYKRRVLFIIALLILTGVVAVVLDNVLQPQTTPPPTGSTKYPIMSPIRPPTDSTKDPSMSPTHPPTRSTKDPTMSPTHQPTDSTKDPTMAPTHPPTDSTNDPTMSPTHPPTRSTNDPTMSPTHPPTLVTPSPTFPTITIFPELLDISSADDLLNPSSPQHEAARWIIEDRAENLSSPKSMLLQRYILALLYYGTNGKKWTIQDNNDLVGRVPSELGSLSQITSLDLSINKLSGTIPTSLGSLTSLTELSLHTNKLSGTIPTSLGSLTGLTRLFLPINKLSGTIPSSLGSLTRLTYLQLFDNKLSGTIPTSFGSLTRLTYLQLFKNKLSGNIPTSLGSLTSLTDLRLQTNNLTGTIPTSLGSLTSLIILYLYENKLSGIIPSELGLLTSLKILRLDTNKLSGSIPASFGSLTSLEALNLENNKLSGIIPTSLGSLTGLTDLRFPTNKLTGTIPTSLGSLTNLINFYAFSNELTGDAEFLCSLPNRNEFGVDGEKLKCSCCRNLR